MFKSGGSPGVSLQNCYLGREHSEKNEKPGSCDSKENSEETSLLKQFTPSQE